MRRDLVTSYVVNRMLRWHEAALWPTECHPSSPTLIILSADDHIVPVDAIRQCAGSWRAMARGVQVLMLPGLGHGGWIGSQPATARMVQRINALTRPAAKPEQPHS